MAIDHNNLRSENEEKKPPDLAPARTVPAAAGKAAAVAAAVAAITFAVLESAGTDIAVVIAGRMIGELDVLLFDMGIGVDASLEKGLLET